MDLRLQRGLGEAGEGGRDRDEQVRTMTSGRINNQAPLGSTGHYIQYPRSSPNGKEDEQEHIYTQIFITKSICFTTETNTTL